MYIEILEVKKVCAITICIMQIHVKQKNRNDKIKSFPRLEFAALVKKEAARCRERRRPACAPCNERSASFTTIMIKTSSRLT